MACPPYAVTKSHLFIKIRRRHRGWRFGPILALLQDAAGEAKARIRNILVLSFFVTFPLLGGRIAGPSRLTRRSVGATALESGRRPQLDSLIRDDHEANSIAPSWFPDQD